MSLNGPSAGLKRNSSNEAWEGCCHAPRQAWSRRAHRAGVLKGHIQLRIWDLVSSEMNKEFVDSILDRMRTSAYWSLLSALESTEYLNCFAFRQMARGVTVLVVC